MMTSTSPHAVSAQPISAAELAARIDAGRAPCMAEVLGPSYFAAGHIPGAVNLPLEGLVERARQLFPHPDAEIVVYCASATCQNSHVAQRKLASIGYSNVRLFAGGKAEWQAQGHALATGG